MPKLCNEICHKFFITHYSNLNFSSFLCAGYELLLYKASVLKRTPFSFKIDVNIETFLPLSKQIETSLPGSEC